MACRTPVVSTKTGWPDEALQTGNNGVLVDVDDVSGLINGLNWVLTLSNENWRNLSENAYATASTATWKNSAKMFEKALANAIDRAARGEIH